MPPIPFRGSVEAAQERLRGIVSAMPRCGVSEDRPGYLAVSFRSRIFGFVDDAQFVLDGERREIHFRCGARKGIYDFGVNRGRMERISRAFRETR